jgi:hypothetical protein
MSFVDLVILAKEKETNTYSSLFLAQYQPTYKPQKEKSTEKERRITDDDDDDVVLFPKYLCI